MHAEAIGDALDQRGTLAGARTVDGLAARGVDREDVVAIHLNARQTVGEGLLRDRLGVRLLLERYRDRPLVVLAHEHDGHVPDAREVERLVEVALGRGAVAEIGHDDDVVIAILRGVGEADGVGQLGRDGNRDRQVALIRSGLTTFQVAGEEQQQLFDRPATPDHRGRLAERGHHPVRGTEHGDAPELRRLLAFDGRERADAPLPLQADHALVEPAREQHRAIQALELGGRQAGIESAVEGAFGVEDRQIFDREPGLQRGSRHSSLRAASLYLGVSRTTATCA
jgi:hypothetical protein